MQVQENIEHLSESKTRDLPTKDLHLLDILTILSRRRKFIFFFTLGVSILTTIIVLLLPSQYTATSILLPPGLNSSGSSAVLQQLGGAGALASVAGASLGIKNPGEIYLSLFRSRTVEDSVIRRFGLFARYNAQKQSGARAALEAHSKVVLGAKDGLITVTATDRDPNKAAEIVNGYIDEFRKFTSNLAITEASQRRIFFQQQLLEAQENLAAAENALKTTEQSTGVLQIDSQTRALIEAAASLRAQVVAKQVQLQGMRSYATDDNPQMVETRQQLSALQSQLTKLTGSSPDSDSDFEIPKGKVPEAGMEYIRKVRDVKYFETISDLIAKQFEMAKLDEAHQGTGIQVVDMAVPPDGRSYPKRTTTVILAFLVSFILSCTWCFLANGLEKINQDPETLSRIESFKATFRS
jgi:uncharacterized protein involved in exopolysaccharide biosynthesis